MRDIRTGGKGRAATLAVAAAAVAVAAFMLVMAWPAFGQSGEAPSAPTGLTGTLTADQVSLTWDDPDDGSITGYQVLRREHGTHAAGVFVTIKADTGSADTSYTDETVEADKTYVYRVKARNTHGLSEWSRYYRADVPESAEGVPARPTGLTATATVDSVSLSWDDPDDGSITGYQILRRDPDVHDGGVFEPIVSDTGTADTSYTDDTVEAGRSYVYRVRARNSRGMGPRSTYHRVEVPRADDGTRAGAIDLGDVTHQDSVIFRDDELDGSSDTVDYYTFELTVTRHVGLGLRQQDANADLYVEDSEGTVLFQDENTGTANEWILENLRSGTYFIRVEAKEAGDNAYKLRYGVEAATQEQQQPTPTRPSNSVATGKPAITGTVQVGETLSAGTSGISDGNGMTNPGFAYQWVRTQGGTNTDISGATGSTHVLTAAELAHTIRVEVSFTDDDGYSETVTSDATSAVTRPPNSAATGQPAITGTVQVGETLSAGTSGISDGNGMTSPGFTYQWLHSVDGTDTDISGATGSTHVLTGDDAGNAFKVEVSFTDDDGYSETVTSDATDTLLVTQEQHDGNEPDPPNPPVCDRDAAVIREILRLTGRSGCAQVTSADLSGIDEKMHIWSWYGLTLESGDFSGLSHVPSMTVFASWYLTIKTGAFTGLSSLDDLYIQGAAGLGLQAGAFNGINQLEELTLYDSRLSSLNADIFAPLTGLKKLDMDRNGFTALPTGALDDLTTLETLDMSFNNIGSIPSGLFGGDGATLTSLKTIIFTANHISSITAGAFDSATELTRLHLGDNDLDALPDDLFDKLTKLEELELRHNDLTSVKRTHFDKLTKLEVLNLRYNKISTWPANLFDDLAALTHLDLRGNGASTMNLSAIDGLTKLTSLDLGANRFGTIPAGTFDPFTELTSLSLSHNRLQSLPAGVFDENTKLTRLDLESNSLSGLTAAVFEKNVALRTLLMAANRITSLPDGILDANTELRALSLRGNPLGEVPVDFFDHLTYLNHLTLPDSIAREPSLGVAELTDGNTIELTYDVPLKPAGALKNLLTAEVNGVERDVTAAGRTGRRVSITLGGAAVTASDAVTLTYTSVRPERRLPSSGILALATPSNFVTYYANDMVGLPIRNGLGQTPQGSDPPAHILPTGEPAISGTQSVGETLTAATSGISDGNGMTSPGFTYQWVRSSGSTDTYISGSTGSTYVLAAEDQGHRISVRVGFSDDDGYWETVTSAATGRIP